MRLVFIDSTPGFSPDRKNTKATGGILNSLTIIPQYMASKGHEVWVASSYPKIETTNGVHYHPIEKRLDIPKWDVTILNRNGVTSPLVSYSHEIGAKVVWWLHDIVDFRYLGDSSYKHVDKIIALSEYCKQSYASFYTIPEYKFVIIPNGVDKKLFYPGKYEDRVKHRLMMASALIKGFTPIYDTWTNMKRKFLSPTFTIYSSQNLHGLEDSKIQKAFLNEMESLDVSVQQPIPPHILADKMREAWILLMPNSYPEICSNLTLQAQACGLPVVSSNIGSAPEFIKQGQTGIITPQSPHDLFWWVKEYVGSVIKLCEDDKLHKHISDNAPKEVLSWDQVGEAWDENLQKLITKI